MLVQRGSMWLLVSVLGFLACLTFSMGPLKFVIAAEIFSSAIRGRALGIADAAAGQITPMLLKEVGSAGTFWFFAFVCFIAFFVIYQLLPETKGKSLEEIESEWKEEGEQPRMHHRT